MIPWILILLIVGLIVLGIVFFFMAKKGKKHEPDYYTFFIMGICFLPLGIALDNIGFLGMGVVFMIVGMANKDKWKRRDNWKTIPPEKRKWPVITLILGFALLIAAIVFYILKKNGMI